MGSVDGAQLGWDRAGHHCGAMVLHNFIISVSGEFIPHNTAAQVQSLDQIITDLKATCAWKTLAFLNAATDAHKDIAIMG